jgi:hypothetical protein
VFPLRGAFAHCNGTWGLGSTARHAIAAQMTMLSRQIVTMIRIPASRSAMTG